jgi:hypothetical protein
MTHNRSTDGARDPWRASLRASRERRAASDRARRWSLRRRGAALGACLVTALGGGVAVAGNGGVTAGSGGSDSGEESTRSSSSTTLRPGSRGRNVKRLQRKLGLRADGVYGKKTKRAVKRFQRRKGLKADGIAGPATLRKLGLRIRRHSGSSGDGSSVRVPAKLRRIAECESGGNPRAVSPDGRYRGKYQFDRQTWRGLGGEGDPADAPESVQDRLAVKLYRQRGSAPWGACADA